MLGREVRGFGTVLLDGDEGGDGMIVGGADKVSLEEIGACCLDVKL